MIETRRREFWVDNVKVIACVLVVVGHFFMSLVAADIFPDSDLYQWFRKTIYYFHVPLFFICSGYLYQKYSSVEDVHSWEQNVIKKLLNLGIPYFTFSIATWFLKTVFSSSVNSEIEGGLFDTLLLHLTSPYWYLYALFFLFLITPTFKSKAMAGIGTAIALVLKALRIIGGGYGIQAISYILANEIWFVMGMCLSVWEFRSATKKIKLIVPVGVKIIFIALSVTVYALDLSNGFINFGLGLLACFSVVVLIAILYGKKSQSRAFGVLAKYTMPIFLMHTLFAASLRMVLMKSGITNAVIHVILGLTISFIGPVIAAVIMKKLKWPEFFLYPGKFIKI